MTVTNLWNSWSNWMPFSKVSIYVISTGYTGVYSHFEDVLRDWSDRTVVSFMHDATTDTIAINIK